MRAVVANVDGAIAKLAPDDGLRAIWRLVSAANKHLADTAPWTLAKDPGCSRSCIMRRSR